MQFAFDQITWDIDFNVGLDYWNRQRVKERKTVKEGEEAPKETYNPWDDKAAATHFRHVFLILCA